MTQADASEASPTPLPVVTIDLPPHLESIVAISRRPLVALAPGGAKNILRDQPLKRWPLSAYVELARMLTALHWRVLIVGADSDAWIKEGFAELDTVDLVGQTSVTDLVAVFGNCDGVVTHDSGPMHLAALARAPLVALFGPTDPAVFAPRQLNVKVLRGGEGLPCCPCYDGREYADCHDNRCMKQISVAQVFAALKDIIASSLPPRRIKDVICHEVRSEQPR